MKLTLRIDNKLILALQIVIGAYLAIVYFLQYIIYNLIYLRFGLLIRNDYPVLTLFTLYLLTAPLAILTSNLLAKSKLHYDMALQAGMIANYTFVLVFAVPALFSGDGPVFAIIGLFFFASLFGFALSAVSAVLYEKIIHLKTRL